MDNVFVRKIQVNILFIFLFLILVMIETNEYVFKNMIYLHDSDSKCCIVYVSQYDNNKKYGCFFLSVSDWNFLQQST